jgi:exportin-1
MHLVREIFAVMTDTFHKPGFKLHARILHHLFGLARPAAEGGLPAPLWEGAGAAEAAAAAGSNGASTAVGAVDPATGAPWASNAAFVAASVSALLSTSFPNLRPTQVDACCRGMFALRDFGAFKEHLRDFLVQTKSFASQDNADLFAEEAGRAAAAAAARLAAIPGMANPHTGAIVLGGVAAGSNGAGAGGGGGGGMGD